MESSKGLKCRGNGVEALRLNEEYRRNGRD